MVLEGRVALVTGASRGIGAAIARELAANGARVAATARTVGPDPRREGSLEETVGAITNLGGVARAIGGDLSIAEDRRSIVAQAEALLGPIDILVNNAAITFLDPFTDFTEKRWNLMVETQLRAPFELAQLAVPQMRARGAGWILNISSRASVHPVGPPYDDVHLGKPWSVYGLVKAGLDRMSTALAAELYPDGIAVNSLSPSHHVETPGTKAHGLVDGYVTEPTSVMARASLLLCSADPRHVTGRVAYSHDIVTEFAGGPARV